MSSGCVETDYFTGAASALKQVLEVRECFEQRQERKDRCESGNLTKKRVRMELEGLP